MLAALALAQSACGLVVHLATASAPAAPSRIDTVRMRTTPQVPYKYPGTDQATWINLYDRMYRERIVFLAQDIDDNFANQMIAVMLYLESDDKSAPISMYFNVNGGVMKAGLALYDTMRMMSYDINTVNMGMAAQVGAFLVASGTPGKRVALPNSRFSLKNPSIEPPLDREGKPVQRVMQATEMRLEVEEVLRDKKRMLEGLSLSTGRSIAALEHDFRRDFYLNAYEASQYGLVDKLLLPKRPSKVKSKDDIKFGSFGGPDFRVQEDGMGGGKPTKELGDGQAPPAGIY